MPICIECSYPVPQLYQRLSSKKKSHAPPAVPHTRNTSSSGVPSHHHPTTAPKDEGFRGGGEAKKAKSNTSADVRLMQCPRCKRFADKYVEHDFVVLFIDLVLVKPQVYRHLLFNDAKLIDTDSSVFTPAVKRLGTLLVLFDVYLAWSAIEILPAEITVGSTIPRLPILGQYLFYLVLCAVTTCTQHVVIRELAQLEWFRGRSGSGSGNGSSNGSSWPQMSSPTTPVAAGGNLASSPKKRGITNTHNATSALSSPPPSRPPSAASTSYPGSNANGSASTGASSASQTMVTLPPPRKNAVSTALLVSSCTKLFPILMVVWKYEDTTGQLASGVSWAVAIQNIEALRILLGSGYGSAAILVALGWLASWLVSRAVLIAVGLGGI